MSPEEFIGQMAHYLTQAGIPFMLTGSHGSSYYGKPRATNDVDFVIDPTSEQLQQFLGLLHEGYYASREAASDALRRRSMFNIILLSEGLKADLIIRKDRPFSLEEFRRRQEATLHGQRLMIASPEDVILAKLEWNLITPSERQLRDVLEILVVQKDKLDRAYLEHWAQVLGVEKTLSKL